MAIACNLGYPRIGPQRELKKATEAYWAGKLSREELEQVGRDLRRSNWEQQRDAGIEQIPSNDFSFYDHVLDACALVGAVPERYGWDGERVDLDTYFHMARGKEEKDGAGADTIAMEMTKWFDTNYHYIVPELEPNQRFRLGSTKAVDEFIEARELGITTRPVLLGPVSFLLLGKAREGTNRLALLPSLLNVYAQVLGQLKDAGAQWVQFDEPCLVLDQDDETRRAWERAYDELASAAPELKILLATYFGGLRDNLPLAAKLPVHGLHVDLVREPDQLEDVLGVLPEDRVLSAGVIDGRNIWRSDLAGVLGTLEKAQTRVGRERLWISPSCSMLHVPIDLEMEKDLDQEIRGWLAFAKQKLGELSVLARASSEGHEAVAKELEANQRIIADRRESARVNNAAVQQRVSDTKPEDARRSSPFPTRKSLQHESLGQPLLPTTTIGSYPQTQEIRRQRAAYRKGKLDQVEYEKFLEAEIERTIREQEEIGIDVLVHGEPERNDMVQYFGEQMTGIVFTKHAWVQSYGSRYVRPPVIYGDVARPEPMTVRWMKYAQSLTEKPVKGMLTGPVTILQWSFVRDDQPRSRTCRQIALAIRDEVDDLEGAGIKAIQIDEPAVREGLPLRRTDWKEYLNWAVECFRLASSGVKDQTQIHTHMCYSEFNDIIDSIGEMDADVISIEASRSQMELLEAFADYNYPNEIGPGVYDIHSPRVPPAEEMVEHLRRALVHLSADQVWVNPDCGLKTRRWEEVRPALRNMVRAAGQMREELTGAPA